jgi:hypothetical protein
VSRSYVISGIKKYYLREVKRAAAGEDGEKDG